MQTTISDPADLSRLVHLFDMLAVAVLAVSGALAASRKGMGVMGFMRLAGFSLDRLVRFLVLLNSDVEIVLKPRTSALSQARVLVA